MTQTGIPFLLMRGGSSRGPYLHRSDLPEEISSLKRVLVSMIGSGHPLNIDGIGGGAAVTTKVAMLSASQDDWADVDYLFAQVGVEDGQVDMKPTCGNILVGVGPAALEMGLATAQGDETLVKIRAINTGARVIARIQTPGREVMYNGQTHIDGVPGTAAPIDLTFLDITGGATGSLFPTGNRVDRIDGIAVTCMDVAMPMVIARADAFGLSGRESAEELDANTAFYDRMEPIRQQAGVLMGMGDVSNSVTPKFGLVAPPVAGGSALVRYFMPQKCHPSLAVTGSQCLSAALLCPGTVASGIYAEAGPGAHMMQLEHPMGQLSVAMHVEGDAETFEVVSASLTRTARKLAQGNVFVPAEILSGGGR